MTGRLKVTVTTWEAALVLGKDPRSFHRWATTVLDVQPVRRDRIGRSTVTIWSLPALREATRQAYAGQMPPQRGEMTMLEQSCSEVA